MIESGEVDYYQHDSNCSNQCRSNKGPSLESTASQGSFNHSFEIDASRDVRDFASCQCQKVVPFKMERNDYFLPSFPNMRFCSLSMVWLWCHYSVCSSRWTYRFSSEVTRRRIRTTSQRNEIQCWRDRNCHKIVRKVSFQTIWLSAGHNSLMFTDARLFQCHMYRPCHCC